jgi:hypothetical protein
MKTITCIAGHDLKAGDAVHIYQPKSRFKRFMNWLMFWRKPVVYTVTGYTETTIDIHSNYKG